MTLYFDQGNYDSAIVRSVVVDGTDGVSDVGGASYLDDDNARLAGVAPEAHVARENLGNVQALTECELVDALHQYFQSTSLTEGVTKKGLHEVLKKYF